ncbi:glycoside hydrolase [Trametes elegans]|nr:glycoside hydrolase [Trametes elegans]
MQLTLLSFSAILALVPFVTAHGYVTDVKIDGITYEGHPYQEETVTPAPDSAIRLVSSKGPITDVSNPELACGPGALPAGLLASAHPGSNISFDWVSTDPSKNYHWFHSAGPILTYMALCEGVPCDRFNASGAKWFKTDEVGLKPGSHTEWYLADLAKGDPYTTEIPDSLKAGQYLIRNEIIANHISPVEFYVSCTQLNVTGDGDGAPDSTVSFPGAYHADDPGLQGFVSIPPPFVRPV